MAAGDNPRQDRSVERSTAQCWGGLHANPLGSFSARQLYKVSKTPCRPNHPRLPFS